MHFLAWAALISAATFSPLPAAASAAILASAFIADYYLESELPKIFLSRKSPSSINARVVPLCPALKRRYFPSFWFANSHLQTVTGSWLRHTPKLKFRREILNLDDGGAIYLDWGVPDRHKVSPTAPIIVVLHGLTGGSHETYVRNIMLEAEQHGWQSVAFNFRGASDSVLHTPMSYNAGQTHDLRSLLKHIGKTHPDVPLYAIGYSLGANILVKYLGEEGARTPLKAAVAVSSVHNLHEANKFMKEPLRNMFYGSIMTSGLKRFALRHKAVLSQSGVVDYDNFHQIRSVPDFDEFVTRRLFGYATVEDYYSDASSDRLLHNVGVPLLLLSALDDPIIPAAAIPYDAPERNPNVLLVTTNSGGHVAFMTDNNLLHFRKSLMDDVAMQYFTAVAQLQESD
eukprot:TRINITY_DN4241_c0_g2_i1.p1 TRINITY_DN4241_c0_g2~~TRINITY_DN4241_c0_g2_i1.p1  ORF type:complete len:399 (-),score=114.43 TRINITY_DN4241_c0_g2_i1:232-1428(-)